jgi:hypothetical protein
MDGNEFLQRSHPAEAEHRAFSSPEGLMRILGSVVESVACFTVVRQSRRLQRRGVGPQLIGDKGMRAAVAFHGFSQEFQCGFSVSLFRDESLQNPAFMIDEAPQVVSDAVDLHEHLIEMPTPVQQVLGVAKRERVSDVEQYRSRWMISGLVLK